MRKRLVTSIPARQPVDHDWLDLSSAAVVEVTSEDEAYPIESALLSGGKHGWCAAVPGPQTIRLFFDKPQELSCIHLDFEETKVSRMQEFVLRWSPDSGTRPYREIVRQQWNFSPPGTVRELETYAVELSGVMVLELDIVPDKSGGEARASLRNLRLA